MFSCWLDFLEYMLMWMAMNTHFRVKCVLTCSKAEILLVGVLPPTVASFDIYWQKQVRSARPPLVFKLPSWAQLFTTTNDVMTDQRRQLFMILLASPSFIHPFIRWMRWQIAQHRTLVVRQERKRASKVTLHPHWPSRKRPTYTSVRWY